MLSMRGILDGRFAKGTTRLLISTALEDWIIRARAKPGLLSITSTIPVRDNAGSQNSRPSFYPLRVSGFEKPYIFHRSTRNRPPPAR